MKTTYPIYVVFICYIWTYHLSCLFPAGKQYHGQVEVFLKAEMRWADGLKVKKCRRTEIHVFPPNVGPNTFIIIVLCPFFFVFFLHNLIFLVSVVCGVPVIVRHLNQLVDNIQQVVIVFLEQPLVEEPIPEAHLHQHGHHGVLGGWVDWRLNGNISSIHDSWRVSIGSWSVYYGRDVWGISLKHTPQCLSDSCVYMSTVCVINCVSITDFHKIKEIFLKFCKKYSCYLQVFPCKGDHNSCKA